MNERTRTFKVDQDETIDPVGQIIYHYRTQVTPPYTNEEIEKIKFGDYIGYKFLQENGFTTRSLVTCVDDVEQLEVKARDLTEEGIQFYYNSFEKYLNAIGKDLNKDPIKSCKRILERDLKKLREGRDK